MIQQKINSCGYFVIATSKNMTVGEALELYKSRDASEKLFRGDKPYLGNKGLRVQSDGAAGAKKLIEFTALIVRCRIHTLLKDEMERLEKSPNYMTVPAAICELEKIEMVRQTDGIYRTDYAVTATQKAILRAFDIDADYVRQEAGKLSKILAKYEERENRNG
nr:hypothetical protein [uncultured Acetatifactor sp.]